MSITRLLAALAATASLALSVPACSGGTTVSLSGRQASESRPVPPFTAVAVSLPGEVVLRQGPFAPVSLEGDEKLLPEVELAVENGTLELRFRRPLTFTGRGKLRFTVTAPSFEGIRVAGSGRVSADSLRAAGLSVALAGSGDVRLAQLEAEALQIALSGSGDFHAAGRAKAFSAKIAGSGDIDAARLETRRASVAIAGSGDARVWATEALSASIAGSGDVRYAGDPAVSRSVVGSGSVRPLEGPSR
jgi:hypothetical protein